MPALPINTNASATAMANEIFGDGVTVVGASYTGDNRSSGIFTNANTVSPGVTTSNSGVILSTGRASQFSNNSGQFNQVTNRTTDTSGPNNVAQFNAAAGANTYDASILDVDFIPTTNTLSMQFVFASEEYPEYTSSVYNDIFAVWVNGTQVPLAVGDGKVSVNSINQGENFNLFVNNTADTYNTEMDGFTVTMTLKFDVIPGVVNSIRIGIADVSDAQYDSAVLISGNSIQGALVANDDEVQIAPGDSKTINVLGNDTGPAGSTLTITHINGVPVTAGSVVTLATGQQIVLNADGTITILADADEETVNFTYTVKDNFGHTDTAFVTVNSVPCLVAGTRVVTDRGERPVETLAPGDLVLTRDHGLQPVTWIGSRRVPATGSMAPIRIQAGAFGRHRTLMVSPQHRVLIETGLSELLFGDREVLIAAKDLVDGSRVRPVEGGEVEYVHLLFDRHQVIFAEGLPTESLLPGPQAMQGFGDEAVDEILTLFPELNPDTGSGYGPAARRLLRAHEAEVLRRMAAA